MLIGMSRETILYFVTYFILYSFIGWVLESVYKSVGQKKLINSGFLIGPICPIYGFGAIIMLLCLESLKDNPILLFIAAFFILSIWEYIVGVILEKLFKTRYWDYSHLKFNIKGRVCLKNSLYWGILGLVFICFVHPFVETYILKIPFAILLYANILIAVWLMADIVISVQTIVSFETAVNKINEIGDTIKEKLEEAKKNAQENANIEYVVEKLNIKQTRLRLKLYKQANRLKQAFPSMKSDIITNFLNQKIDLKKLKASIKNKE